MTTQVILAYVIAKLTIPKYSRIGSGSNKSVNNPASVVLASDSAATSKYMLIHPEVPAGTKNIANLRNTYDTHFSLDLGSYAVDQE